MDRISGRELLWLLALTVVAALLRFHHLGEWPLFGDEVDTLVESRDFMLLEDGGGRKSWTLSTNVLNHLLTGFSYELFGESLFSARFFPALFGLLTIPVLFFLLRLIFPWSVSFLTVLFITFSANHIFLSGFARYNAMLFFFGGAAFLTLLTGWLRKRMLFLALGATLALLAIFTHTTGIFVVFTFILFAAGYVVVSPNGRKTRIISLALLAFVFLVIGFIFREDLQYVSRVISRDFVGAGKGYPPMRLAGSIAYNDGLVYSLFAMGAVMLVVFKRDSKAIAVAIYWAIPFLLLFTASRWMAAGPRYLHSVLPGFYILAALGVHATWASLGAGKRWAKALLCVLIIATQAPLFVSNWNDGGRYDTTSAARFLMENKRPGELVFAEGHMIYDYLSKGTIGAKELPYTLPQLLSSLEEGESALIVFPLQRNVPLGFQGRDYRIWLERNCDLLVRFTTKRCDIMRYEIVVYRFRGFNPPS